MQCQSEQTTLRNSVAFLLLSDETNKFGRVVLPFGSVRSLFFQQKTFCFHRGSNLWAAPTKRALCLWKSQGYSEPPLPLKISFGRKSFLISDHRRCRRRRRRVAVLCGVSLDHRCHWRHFRAVAIRKSCVTFLTRRFRHNVWRRDGPRRRCKRTHAHEVRRLAHDVQGRLEHPWRRVNRLVLFLFHLKEEVSLKVPASVTRWIEVICSIFGHLDKWKIVQQNMKLPK